MKFCGHTKEALKAMAKSIVIVISGLNSDENSREIYFIFAHFKFDRQTPKVH